jgi:hypothetical protein
MEKSKSVPNDRFFNDSIYKPLQEMWAAGYFALGLKQFYDLIEVRLNPDRFPDFFLLFRKTEIEFELTIASKPERMMGKDHKEHKINSFRHAPYQPGRGSHSGPSWIANAIIKKQQKLYSESPHLLVYANFEAESLDSDKISKLCSNSFQSFKSIWVLWHYQILKVYGSHFFEDIDQTWHNC